MTGSTPTVTITVGGVVVTPNGKPVEDIEEHLYMVYVQATKDTSRKQWVIIPPKDDKEHLFLQRLQEFEGNRAKWCHERYTPNTNGQGFAEQNIKYFADNGWDVGKVVVVKLEMNDYEELWGGTTSHKALRAVERELLAVHKITLK